MFLKIVLVCSVAVAYTLAEAPLQQHRKSGPYPAAGWRPRKPFNLPGEYSPPVEVEAQRQHPQVDVAVTKERVDFIGQAPTNGLSATNEPQNAYLPPDHDDYPKEQELPSEGRNPFFNKDRKSFGTRPRQHPQQPQQNIINQQRGPQAQSSARPQQQPQLQHFQPQQQSFKPQPQTFQPQQQTFQPQQQISRPHQQSFKPQPQSVQPQQQSFQPPQQSFQPQQQSFQPQQQSFQPQQQSFQPQQQQFFPEEQQQRPAKQYGAPLTDSDQVSNVYPDPRQTQKDTDYDLADDLAEDGRPFEAFNTAVTSYNHISENRNAAEQDPSEANEHEDNEDYRSNVPPSRSTKGQYYIVGPDNSIQRVMFTTRQDEKESGTNGFTAQLKYSPAGEVRDPIYRYNNRGQLVRVVKK